MAVWINFHKQMTRVCREECLLGNLLQSRVGRSMRFKQMHKVQAPEAHSLTRGQFVALIFFHLL